MRKHCILALLVVGLMYGVTSTAVAQNGANNDQQAAAPADHSRRHFDPAERTERLTKQLKLTADQQPKVLDILKSEQSQMESLRSDSSVSQDDHRAKMMDIRKASNDQIRALLDADQQKKFDAMESRQWQGHHHDGQGQGAAPDSAPQK